MSLPRVTLLEDEEGNCHLRNLSMHLVGSEEEALNLLFLGDTNRAISVTAMNQVPCASHCVCVLRQSTSAFIIITLPAHLPM